MKPQALTFKFRISSFKLLVACGLWFVAYSCVLCSPVSPNTEEFIYDSHGKKDPFAPPVLSGAEKVDIEMLTGIKLEGIIWDEKNPMAIINDKIVGVGEEIAGAKIVGITENEVVFNVNGQEIKLRLRIIEEGEI